MVSQPNLRLSNNNLVCGSNANVMASPVHRRWQVTQTVVGQLVLFVTRRFLRESARREASRSENGTIRLRIALRIFLGLGKTPETACQGGFVLGKYGSFGLAPTYDPWFAWFGSKWCRDQIYNFEMFNFECGAFPRHATANYNNTKYKQMTV